MNPVLEVLDSVQAAGEGFAGTPNDDAGLRGQNMRYHLRNR